ncbi:hypothetical protein MtrunA17_Chr6g0472231 [Medicago truncatula]|uniref:Uncharacterized protein n=1 Tax=Medicago truncatula TaxID=3880 RepID=A0A396HEI7_MEDTR|nr:hypothetical protein MtrunA17_Chr6g0472231 [Medicago truncatula]
MGMHSFEGIMLYIDSCNFLYYVDCLPSCKINLGKIKFGQNCICWVEDKIICRFGLLYID